MKEKTKQLRAQLADRHDWQDGQTYGGSGTILRGTNTCAVCGMADHWLDDRQNGIHDQHTYTDSHGDGLTLAEAAAVECC